MNFGYVMNSLFWSLVGGGGGYYVGRLRRDVSRIQERVDDVDNSAAPKRRHKQRGFLARVEENYSAVGVVVVIMALATVALVIYQKVQLDRVTTCYVSALTARDKDTNQSRQFAITYAESTEHMIDGILATAPPSGAAPQEPTQEQRNNTLQAIIKWKADNRTYRTSLEKAQRSAQANPLFSTRC